MLINILIALVDKLKRENILLKNINLSDYLMLFYDLDNKYFFSF